MLLSYSEFIRKSLYGQSGYYRKNQRRIGFSHRTDFYTASSVPLFGKLLGAAFTTLKEIHHLENPTLVELGNEPDSPVFLEGCPGFGASLNFPLDALTRKNHWKSPAVVFCNELFDALPFDRFVRRKGIWRILGLDADKKIMDLEMGKAPAEDAKFLGDRFPDGATVDISPEAPLLIERLPEWTGLFVIFDYGLTLSQLLERPRPTGRAYHKHRLLSLGEALSLKAGEYDITHHVMWDLIAGALRKRGFSVATPTSQESFFVKHASGIFPTLSSIERKQLSELIHPSNMGQSFEIMVASRSDR
jgi:SAM-dependent MidA family methyltransferase